MKELYFAYGSNLNLGKMAARCPTAYVMSRAVLEGYELAFRRGVLTILPKEGGKVQGALWKVNARDEQALDRYEGYPHLYTKKLLSVQTDSGQQNAIAYVMTAPCCEQAQPPSAAYLKTVLDGYQLANFDPNAVLQAAASARQAWQQIQRKHPDKER